MNQIIDEKIKIIIDRIIKQKNKSINEAQTKEWLIKPFFTALNWDFSNPDEVIPEDDDAAGKRTDYSFYINNKPKLLIEAKPLKNNLDDDKMIMEKLNYCSNSGTPLLIITNGDLYRIYYADLKGIGKEKLLKEFCLSENIDEEIIDMLSRQSFEKDLLLNYSKNISILSNIKNVLEKLFIESNKTIINLINEGLKDKIGFKFHDDEIKKALKNISIEINTISTEAIADKPITFNVEEKRTQKVKAQKTKIIDTEYNIDDHFRNGNWKVGLNILNEFIKYLSKNDFNVNLRPLKHYISIDKSEIGICEINAQKKGIKMFLHLNINDLSEFEVIKVRDVSQIGRLGLGAIEYKLENDNDFEIAFGLLKKSFNKKNY